MKVFFSQKNRIFKIENTKRNPWLWEERDGFHSFNNDAILKDEENKRSPKIVFIEGLISPIGSAQTKEYINNLVTTINLTKRSGGVIPISKVFGRWMEGIMKYIGIIILVVLIIVGIVMSGQPVE